MSVRAVVVAPPKEEVPHVAHAAWRASLKGDNQVASAFLFLLLHSAVSRVFFCAGFSLLFVGSTVRAVVAGVVLVDGEAGRKLQRSVQLWLSFRTSGTR